MAVTGLSQLKEGQAGKALKLLAEAKVQQAAAAAAGPKYDVAVPKTRLAERTPSEKALKEALEGALSKANSENSAVYFQSVPAEVGQAFWGGCMGEGWS